MTVCILARTWPLQTSPKRGVAVIHARVVDIEVDVLPGQAEVILAHHVSHGPFRIGLGLEHLHTETRPRDVISQTSRSMPLKPLYISQPGQGTQLIAWHPGQELGPKGRAILP